MTIRQTVVMVTLLCWGIISSATAQIVTDTSAIKYEGNYTYSGLGAPTTFSTGSFTPSTSHFAEYDASEKIIKTARVYVYLSHNGPIVCTAGGSCTHEAVIDYDIKQGGSSISNGSLTIDINNHKALKIKDITLAMTSSDYIDVELEQNSLTTLTGSNVKIDVVVEIRYGLNQSGVATALSSLTATQLTNSRRVEFAWNVGGSGSDPDYYPAYELQVTRLENTDPSVGVNGAAGTIDWNNAMKLYIDKSLWSSSSTLREYTVTLAEGSGLYAWRVRPIGNYVAGGYGNSSNYGTFVPTHSTTYSFTNYFNPNQTGFLYFTEPEENLNWIYSRTFTESANISESMGYANTLLQKKQSQIYLPGADQLVLNQQVYDYSGRPALGTLPVPETGTAELNYRENFLLPSGSSSIYNASNFDIDTKVSSPDDVDETGEFAYYNNNSSNAVGNADGFPYTRTRFTNDGTGRPLEESGAGTAHNMSSGRTVRHYYSTASDEELVRVMGSAAPAGDMVYKEITTDQDGVSTVTYKDYDNKVIATALLLTSNSFEANETINGKMTAPERSNSTYKRLSLTNETNELTIGYTFDSPTPTLELGCYDVSSSPEYDYRVYLHCLDNPGLSMYFVGHITPEPPAAGSGEWKYILTDDDVDVTAGTPATNLYVTNTSGNFPFEFHNLPQGDWVVEKMLEKDMSAATSGITAHYNTRFENIKTLIDWVDTKINASSGSDIGIDNFMKEVMNCGQTTCTTPPVRYIYKLTPVLTSSTACSFSGTDYEFIPNSTSPEYILFKCSYTSLPLTAPCTLLHSSQYYIVSHENPDNVTLELQQCYDLTRWEYTIDFNSGCCSLPLKFSYFPDICVQVERDMESSPAFDAEDHNYMSSIANTMIGMSGCTTCSLEDMLETSPLFPFINNSATPPATKAAMIEDLDKMFYHMINDLYNGSASPQYECDEVMSCWKGAVKAYIDAKLVSAPSEDVRDVMGDGTTPDPDDDDETAFDPDQIAEDVYSQIPGGWLLKIFGKKKREDAIQEIKDQLETMDLPDSDEMFNQVDYFAQFMDCAGRKFHDRAICFQTGTDPDDFCVSTTAYKPFDVNDDGDDTDTGDDDAAKDLFDDITAGTWLNVAPFDRVYAFKYYRYSFLPNLSSLSLALNNIFSIRRPPYFRSTNCEINTCFCGEAYQVDNGTTCVDIPICDLVTSVEKPDVTCTSTDNYSDWTSADHQTFFDCIQSVNMSNQLGSTDNPDWTQMLTTITDFIGIGADEDNTMSYFNVTATNANGQIQSCLSKCESRRAEFRALLIKEMTENCYNIVDDFCQIPTYSSGAINPEFVLRSDIDVLVDELVNHCESMCDLNLLQVSFKNCCDESTNRTYIELEVGSPQEQEFWNAAMYFNFDLQLPSKCTDPVGSNCSSPTEFDGTAANYRICATDYTMPSNTTYTYPSGTTGNTITIGGNTFTYSTSTTFSTPSCDLIGEEAAGECIKINVPR